MYMAHAHCMILRSGYWSSSLKICCGGTEAGQGTLGLWTMEMQASAHACAPRAVPCTLYMYCTVYIVYSLLHSTCACDMHTLYKILCM